MCYHYANAVHDAWSFVVAAVSIVMVGDRGCGSHLGAKLFGRERGGVDDIVRLSIDDALSLTIWLLIFYEKKFTNCKSIRWPISRVQQTFDCINQLRFHRWIKSEQINRASLDHPLFLGHPNDSSKRGSTVSQNEDTRNFFVDVINKSRALKKPHRTERRSLINARMPFFLSYETEWVASFDGLAIWKVGRAEKKEKIAYEYYTTRVPR